SAARSQNFSQGAPKSAGRGVAANSVVRSERRHHELREFMPLIAAEKLISFPQAARLVPRVNGGNPPSATTVLRWATRGCRDTNGNLVKLENWLRGGRRVTSVEALSRFFARLNGAKA